LSSSPSLSLIAEVQRPYQKTFEKQIPMVLSWAELRDDRATEVLAQIDPQYAFWAVDRLSAPRADPADA
jgi:hypothetical protein